ncbi:hypothetical protein FACS1894139_04780 [Planctomycetales bacterium]|nr:hypothetical protein FACS1894107_03480 [Planctomycetales bacterium]GHS96963.1 hypothetical protein FACS1894108_02520 [Planctomycetales bacterium]GHT03751.1 hypothetical protein FACS1894139_04780 [Planctomycetales bacterium]GHV22646.1 hypothetical protein AGMMS49959_13810 [Planctomycetales bacterium]
MLTMPLSFDALDWLARFKAAGFSEQQAKVQIEVIEKAVEIAVEATEKKIADNRLLDEKTRQELATKGDIHDLEIKLVQIKADLELKIEKLRNSSIMWLVGGFVTQTALLLTVLQWR